MAVKGLSKFCQLRPKECFIVGARGTHSVCVCTLHQNVKLKLSALPTESQVTYHDLMEKNWFVMWSQRNACFTGVAPVQERRL